MRLSREAATRESGMKNKDLEYPLDGSFRENMWPIVNPEP